MSSASPFSILCICTGNVCRSPAAERMLTAGLGSDVVVVTSAGTQALVGQPMAAPMAALVSAAGADAAGFRARRLAESLIAPADLVLAMTQAHRGDVVALHPRSVRRTFTLRELARLLAQIDQNALPVDGVGERLRAAVPLAGAVRRQVVDPSGDDVIDPYRQSDDIYAASFAAIEQAVALILDVLRPH